MKTIVSPKVIAPQPGTKSNCKVFNGQIFVSGMTGRDNKRASRAIAPFERKVEAERLQSQASAGNTNE